MDEDPFSGLGLRPVELADRAVLNPYFASLAEPLSDYTFSQLYTWRNSLRILWKQIDGHLCVFANGTGDLTLLMPPIGDSNGTRALAQAFELMDDYNAAHGVAHRTRVEYASDELLTRFDRTGLMVKPMGADYVYDVDRMIDLAGSELASKRQAKNRFMRNYEYRVEPYSSEKHRLGCMALLDQWKVHQDAQHLEETDAASLKRSKESIATALCLESAEALGLKGLVVYVKGRFEGGEDPFPIRAFTFGEPLGRDQSSITIEKTDLSVKGLAQFIFSEFCRVYWGGCPLVNVGDDWGLETLAWTKRSYRPVKMLQKYVVRRQPAVLSAGAFCTPSQRLDVGMPDEEPLVPPRVTIRAAGKADLAAAVELEQSNFTTHALNKRQLCYLQQRDTAIFLVAQRATQVIGEGIALVRRQKKGLSGRIYSLVVHPESRGRKIGQRLLAEMIDALAARGARRIYLEVEKSNTPAIALYHRSGFRTIGDLPDYYGKGVDGAHMMYEQPSEAPVRVASAVRP